MGKNLNVTREEALDLLKKYNKETFHLQHAYTVEAVMRWYANELGYAEDADFWAIAGLLHDVDFENWPEEHCVKAPELLREAGFDDRFIHAVCSHAYGMTSDVEPEHQMEKVLFAADELTGLKHPQKLGLGCHRELTDLIQKYSTSVGLLKISPAHLVGSGK